MFSNKQPRFISFKLPAILWLKRENASPNETKVAFISFFLTLVTLHTFLLGMHF